jgi:Protein of unknown function (DUF1524)
MRLLQLPASSLQSTELQRILLDFDVSTALPLIMFLEMEAGLDKKQLADCLSVLESFITRRVFASEENKEYNKLFVDVVDSLKGLKGEKILPSLIHKLLSGRGSTRHWPTDDEIIEKAISSPIFKQLKTSALRLILERLEIASRTKKAESQIVPLGLQIEHVLPQKWASHWTLNGQSIPVDIADSPYLAKDELAEHINGIRQRNTTLHTLGNLTLVNKYLNPAASNGSFNLKLIEYKNSVLQLNRYFDSWPVWDEQPIAKRSRDLAEIFCKIWPRLDQQ